MFARMMLQQGHVDMSGRQHLKQYVLCRTKIAALCAARTNDEAGQLLVCQHALQGS
jgi:hypothetical protein